jgi:hypothetical protein
MDRDNNMDLDALLQATLDAYGGDTARWPSARRRQLAAFVETSPDATRSIGEATALDRLLDASAAAAPREIPMRLVADIMAKATGKIADRAADHRSAQVVRLEPARRVQTDASPKVPLRPSRAGYWQAAAMLAASLLLGVFIGGTGQFNATVAQLDAYLGGATTTEIAILLPNPLRDEFDYAGEDPL